MRELGENVAPTDEDPLARAASTVAGGPLGEHARRGSWWSPLTIMLLIVTVMFALGVVQKSPCIVTNPAEAAAPLPFSHMCYSDMGPLYVARGFAEGQLPYEELPSDISPEERRERTVEYPVLTGVWMGLAAFVTHLVGKSPDLHGVPHAEVGGVKGVQYDQAVFWGVNTVGFFVVLLISITLLVKANRRRPWDLAALAAAPTLALAGTINWDIIAIGWVAAFFWAWSSERPIVAGLFIGLGTATKLFPLFFLGPLLVLCLRERRMDTWVKTAAAALVAWLAVDLPVYLASPDAFMWFWRFNNERGGEFGSFWYIFSLEGRPFSPSTINLTTWMFFGASCLAIAALGFLARRRPRLPQLCFLVVASLLLVNKVYSPQYVLWLLPLAVLARPRWRDLLLWQVCEIVYFAAVWLHIAGFITTGGHQYAYAWATAIRLLGTMYLMAVVVRDILSPWNDPVRSSGISDDPVGGILDEGLDRVDRPALRG